MRVIILAAGQSKRFQKAGYKIPKPFLKIEWNGVTAMMLEHVIINVPLEFNLIDIAIPPGWSNKITECSSWKESLRVNFHVIEFSRGPADTANQVLEKCRPQSTLILDTDILNSSNDLLKLVKLNHCGVLVRRSANPAYSYVDRIGEFQTIKEKERISEYAVQGAYYIPRTAMDEFKAVINNVISLEPEPYMSHVFDRMAILKYAVPTTYIPVDWGTPQDVELSGATIVSESREEANARD